MNNNIFSWKCIEGLNITASDNTTWKSIGTYPELINASEVIFTSSGGFYQAHVWNIGNGSDCKGNYVFAGVGESYDHCDEFRINFTTGAVQHRQVYGSSSSSNTYTSCYYK